MLFLTSLFANSIVAIAIIGKLVNNEYKYLYSIASGDANVVSHNAIIGIYATDSLYFLRYITYP